MIILGCSADIDKWGIEWPSTVAGNNATYDCYMSTGMHYNAISCSIILYIIELQLRMHGGLHLQLHIQYYMYNHGKRGSYTCI